jgi:multidrug efflux pump subunit AcrB
MTQAVDPGTGGKRFKGPSDRRVEAFAEWILRWRWAVIVASLALAMASGFGG